MLEEKRSHDEYGEIQYGGLPAKSAVFIIMLPCDTIQFSKSA
jgi:hypothetical protein